MLELIGVCVFAGSVASAAVLSKIYWHRPQEIRSPNPLDFELTHVEAYNRLHTFLSAGQIGQHRWTIKETVDPLYIVAEINYLDTLGKRCDAVVTFDIVEGYKSTTTVRWSCRFLKWCDKATAESMEKLLDSWIQSCLIPQLQVPPSLMYTNLLEPLKAQGIHPSTSENSEGKSRSLQEKLSPVKDMIAKGLAKPATRSPDPLQFQVPLARAYALVLEVMIAAKIDGYKWTIKDKVEDAYIVAQLNFRESKPQISGDAMINFDFTEPAPEQVSITWSCEFLQHCDESVALKVEQAVAGWLKVVLAIPEHEAGTNDPASGLFSFDAPVEVRLKSGYPREFAYIKVLQRVSQSETYTKWKLLECHRSASITSEVMHKSLKKDAFCTAKVNFEFSDNDDGSVLLCTYVFNPDSDVETLHDFLELTNAWLQLVIRR